MKSIGIVRKVDELGRIVLPIELRRILDIEVRDEMEVFIEDGKLVLRKFESACTFCGSTDELSEFRGKHICRECATQLNELS